jgi:hypothetical protein
MLMRMNISVPDELAEQVRERDLPISAICQRALREAVSRLDVGAEQRLFGMMQHLMRCYATRQPPEVPPARDVVTLQDALDSVLQVAAVIDEATQAGQIPAHRGVHASAMLMIARDYIQPLPRGLADDGVTDHATADLAELVALLRQAREASGLRG